MNVSASFVDTNILVHAHNRNMRDRHEKARVLVASLWEQDPLPVTSVQVLQELYVTLLRVGLSMRSAREIVEEYGNWRVVENSKSILLAAFSEQQRWKLSFWDASILAAARFAGVEVLLTEDFNTGQDYDGICAVDPLAG